jgi:dihydroorotate dehydrogenase electron transfer subunit
MVEEEVSIAFNRQIARDTWVMGFRSESVASCSYPGQFLMIRVTGESRDPLLRRPFSIHEIGDKDTVVILYKIVGKGTSLLSSLKDQDSISVLGPLGKGFPLPFVNETALLVGGGMGIAPLFFLAQTLRKEQRNRIRVLLGFPTFRDTVCIDQLRALNVDLSLTTEDGSLGQKGIVTDLLDEYLKHETTPESIIYACGPKPMLKRVSQTAMTSQLRCFVSLESYMACGLGMCLGCAVKAAHHQDKVYYYVCQDGPVFPAETIDWEAG